VGFMEDQVASKQVSFRVLQFSVTYYSADAPLSLILSTSADTMAEWGCNAVGHSLNTRKMKGSTVI
jgi:hypothetical protein